MKIPTGGGKACTPSMCHMFTQHGSPPYWKVKIQQGIVDWHTIQVTTSVIVYLTKKVSNLLEKSALSIHINTPSCRTIQFDQTNGNKTLRIASDMSSRLLYTRNMLTWNSLTETYANTIMSPMCPGSIWCHGELSVLTLKNDLSARFGGCRNSACDSPSTVLTAQYSRGGKHH